MEARQPESIDVRVKVRNPKAAAALNLVTLGLYGLLWYYKINRELRDFGRATEDAELGDSAPWLSLLAITLGGWLVVPPLVSYFGAAGRLQRAEHHCAFERRHTRAILVLFVGSSAACVAGAFPLTTPLFLGLALTSTVAWTVAATMLQSRLNAVLKTQSMTELRLPAAVELSPPSSTP